MKRISVSASSRARAGSLDLTLEKEGSEVRSTAVVKPSLHESKTLTETLSPHAILGLYAVGHPGLDGQIGANGEKGAHGLPGKDATQGTPGEDGGPGGDGADGGLGTSGGDGTRGGDITIRVQPGQTELLDMIDEIDVSGGAPGKKGAHGKGGAGGEGGVGGRAFYWQTSKIIYLPPPSVTVVSYSSPAARVLHASSHGHVHAHFSAHPESSRSSYHAHPSHTQAPGRYKTVYESHTTPGGRSGPPGRHGRTPTIELKDGRPGECGTVKIIIKGDRTEHTSPYSLSLIPTASSQEFFEPGEIIRAIYYVKNAGMTMSSPAGIPIRLDFHPKIKTIKEGQIAGSIGPNTTSSNQESPLEFYYPWPNPTGATPFRDELSVSAFLYNSLLQRPYNHETKRQTYTIQYPIQFEVPHALHYALGRGEETVFPTIIRNIGSQALGRKTSSQREVILDISSNPFSAEPSINALSVPEISKESPYHHETKIKFPLNASWGDRAQFQVNLFLDVLNPAGGDKILKLIQSYLVQAQLTPQYQPTTNGFLLVIDSQTTTEEIQTWRQTLIGLMNRPDIAIWNSTYYGGFSLDRRITEGKTLAEETYGGTVIVLDKQYSTAHSPKRNNDYLTPSMYLEAEKNNISLIAAGQDMPFTFCESSNYPVLAHASAEAMIEALFFQSNLPLMHQLPVQSTGFFGWNTALKQAQQLQKKLALIFSHEEYRVSYRSDSQQLLVHRVHLDRHLPKINWSKTDDFSKQLLPLLSFQHQLEIFSQTENTHHRELARIILEDLRCEQAQLMKALNYQSLWNQITQKHQRNFSQELKKLNTFVCCLESMNHKNRTEWMPIVLNLIACVQYEAKQQVSFWTRLLSFIFPQEKVRVKDSILLLCESACTALNVDASALAIEEKRVALQWKIKACIDKKPSFWSTSCLKREEKEAAIILLKVCNRELPFEQLSFLGDVLNNTQLKQLKNELFQLDSAQIQLSSHMTPRV